jgi:hypothetical protein
MCTGLVIGNFEWLAPFCLALLGVVFAGEQQIGGSGGSLEPPGPLS